MDQNTKNPTSVKVNQVAGVVLGTIVATGATWLYKTKQGKQFRKKFSHQYGFAKKQLNELVAEIKHQAEELERAEGSAETIEKLEAAKKRLTKKTVSAVKQIKKKVFLKSGRPLLK
ncbi:MAG TPA: YtxH domain-containing protein [Patescibacteria group bacterium]|nr:YtxH domain-containing protein [Patescibacteria group bacterium]